MVQGWNDGTEPYNVIHDLKRALKQIVEIAYSGHPDGREARLAVIERTAQEALKRAMESK
jgi:hypothetical protein